MSSTPPPSPDSPLQPMAQPPLQAMTHAELAAALRAAGSTESSTRRSGVGSSDAAAQLAADALRAVWLRDRAATGIGGLASLGRSRRSWLAAAASLPRLEREAVEPAADGSTRYAFRLHDGAVIESVLLPHHAGSERYTVCVSSQAGCALACRFCATGALGLIRSLAAWEIADQVAQVTAHAGVRASDIVFMGMGEPLQNESAVYRAARAMTQAHGLQIGARRITISTAGVVPAIHRFIDSNEPWRLVFSLGAAVPEKRARLMPIQQRHSFDAFLDAVARYERHRRGKHVTLEYVAIRDLTMGDDDVAAIAALRQRGFRFLLNVIPFNPVGDEFTPPTMAEVRDWTRKLRPLGVPVKLRFSGGRDRFAGCGQLGTARISLRR